MPALGSQDELPERGLAEQPEYGGGRAEADTVRPSQKDNGGVEHACIAPQAGRRQHTV